MKQVLAILEPGGLAQLPQSPSGIRMCCEVVMHQAAATVFAGHDDQEIAGNDAPGVQA
jgi:hypothetical protein